MHPDPTACRAPSVSLYFTTAGDVLACCQSTPAPLGNVTEQPLDEIWRGERARAMREELAAGSLPPGCRFCAWQQQEGGPPAMYARNFDRFPLPEGDPGWPRQLEFALSNRCNLECVMCNGDLSSTIRARRERRAPLVSPYGDEFFDQLVPFLAHAEQARFLGGEPFLIPEYQRIWDLLADLGRPVACDVTTNGTVWTERIARTLEALPFSIAVSIDGMRRETVEAIRVGADLDVVLANIDRFAAYCRERGTPFALAYCLMQPNWRELPALLAFADALGADAFVNTVTWPAHLSLYDLPAGERARVADELEALGAETVPDHPVLRREVARLRAHQPAPGETPWFESWSPVPVTLQRRPPPDLDATRARLATGGAEVDELVTDEADRVVAVGPSGRFLGTPAEDLLGRSYRAALEAPTARWGPLVLVSDADVGADDAERLLLYDGDPQTRVHAVTVVERDEAGTVRRATTLATVVEDFPALTPASS